MPEAPPAPPPPASSTPRFDTSRSPGPTVPSAPLREIDANSLGARTTRPPSDKSQARADRASRLYKDAQMEPPKPPKPATPPESPPPAPEPTESPKPETDDAPADVPHGTEPPKPTEGAPPVPTAAPDKRKNPWKLYDAEKKRTVELETELQKLRGERVPDQERTGLMDRVTKAETRAKELEDHIRFVDYEKSSEFADKYHKPYVKAWTEAMGELSEITITDSQTQQPRAVTTEDMQALLSLPLGEAKKLADERFGEFADVAMQHRKAIRDLSKQRGEALESAKKNGGERQKQLTEQQQAQEATFFRELGTVAQGIIKEMMEGPYAVDFKPISIPEGKQPTPEEKEWNEQIQRGYSEVEKYLVLNPQLLRNAKTPDERREIVAYQIALRNRAAAYPAMRRRSIRQAQRIKTLESELAKFDATTPSPTNGQSRQGGGAPPTTSARSQREQKLRRLAGM